CRTRVIIGPERFWSPPGTKRYFGATTMFTSLNSDSPHYLGRGNSAAARDAIDYLAPRGASFLALGPVQLFDFPFDVPGGSPFIPVALGMLTHHCLDVVACAKELSLHNSLAILHAAKSRAAVIRLQLSRKVQLYDYDKFLLEALEQMWREFKQVHL